MKQRTVIVGAGITGLSIAWHLAQDPDHSVLLLDGAGVGAGASSIQPGGVRQQWGTPLSCRLAVESFQFYEQFDERMQVQVSPGLTKCGYLFVAETPESLAQLQGNVALQNSQGIASRMVDGSEAETLVPALRADGIAGAAWHDQDGYFDRPLAVVNGFYDAALRLGVAVRLEAVRGIERISAGWSVELASGATEHADNVVLATAYATPDLTNGMGIQVPIAKEAKYLFYSNPVSQRLLDPLAVFLDRHFAAKQLADGSVLASDLAATDDPETGKDQWYRLIKESIRERLPVLDLLSFPVLVEGFYDVTPDRQPIIGDVPGYEGLWIAAGLNGRGLMMAPAIGRLLSESIEAGTATDELAPLGLSRFAVDELIPERQIV